MQRIFGFARPPPPVPSGSRCGQRPCGGLAAGRGPAALGRRSPGRDHGGAVRSSGSRKSPRWRAPMCCWEKSPSPWASWTLASGDELAATELWPAPTAKSRPLAVNRDKLQEVLKHFLGDVAPCASCRRVWFSSGARGLRRTGTARVVVNALTPLLKRLEGEASLREFKLPSFLFLDDPNNSLKVQPSGDIARAGWAYVWWSWTPRAGPAAAPPPGSSWISGKRSRPRPGP